MTTQSNIEKMKNEKSAKLSRNAFVHYLNSKCKQEQLNILMEQLEDIKNKTDYLLINSTYQPDDSNMLEFHKTNLKNEIDLARQMQSKFKNKLF